MKLFKRRFQVPLLVGSGFLGLLILVELAAILALNDGLLVYTLDDAYIHLALAENIISGHYGVNDGEFSAPSSSILWPLLMAPVAAHEYAPWLINSLAAGVTVFFFIRILRLVVGVPRNHRLNFFISLMVVLLILATNLTGLIYTGMEHSLQLLLVVMIAYGLMVEIEEDRLEPWLLVAIVLAPLIRYENAAISVAALGYLLLRRYLKPVALASLVLAVLIGGFSLFLTSLGLDLLPTSVIAKSSMLGEGSRIDAIVANLNVALRHQQGLVLMAAGLVLGGYALLVRNRRKRQLALVSALAILLHVLVGKYGWYNRYEVYIWSFMLLVGLYLLAPWIKAALQGNPRKFMAVVVGAAAFVALTTTTYILGLFTVPVAANNIYEQHYQMHRFVVHVYNGPVAVNDLGYVSYKNDHYVLDLGGLASRAVLTYRHNGDDDGVWMTMLADEHEIGLVMIYDEWFNRIPETWIKLGELELSKARITPPHRTVSFYATSSQAYAGIAAKLPPFIETLPPGVRFLFAND